MLASETSMNRHQARFVIGLAIFSVVCGVGYRLSINLWAQQQSDQELNALAEDIDKEEGDQRMQDFRRVKMQDGKKVWEIAAKQARFFEEQGEVVVEAPQVSFYVDDGDVIALSCRQGLVQLGEKRQEVVRMELSGDLEMQIGEYSLKTQKAIYESARNTVFAPDSIRIMGRGLTVEGTGYHVAVDEKRVILNADVHTTLVREES